MIIVDIRRDGDAGQRRYHWTYESVLGYNKDFPDWTQPYFDFQENGIVSQRQLHHDMSCLLTIGRVMTFKSSQLRIMQQRRVKDMTESIEPKEYRGHGARARPFGPPVPESGLACHGRHRSFPRP